MRKTSCSAKLTTRTIRFLFITGLLVLCAYVVILASVPPVSRDALTHHLAVPKLYLEHGGIYEIPELLFSYYPMNLDLLYLIPLAFGNDIIPKYIHFAFALLTSFLIYSYLKNRIGETWGLLGSLFFLSIPVIIKLSTTVYVDLGLLFFTTASVLLLFRWAKNGYRLRDLSLAALCCGLAVGTKYNGLIGLLLLSGMAPILYSRSHPERSDSKKMILYGAIFAFIALATASPWFIRNYVWTGNPLYPLFQQIFSPTIQQNRPAGLGILATRHLVYGETPLQILMLPFRVFLEGQDNNPQYFDGKLNPFLLILPVMAFLRQKQARIVSLEKVAMLIFSILFFLFAMFQTDMRIRYIAPIVPFLVILSILGLQSFYSFLTNHLHKRLATLFISILILSILSYNLNYLTKLHDEVQAFAYISGKVDRDTYITLFRPEYPVIQKANMLLPTKTLCLFLGNRGYYMNFRHIFDVPTNKRSYFTGLVTHSTDAAAIANELIQDGFSHLLVRNDLTNNWLQHLGQHQEITAFFFHHQLRLVYTAKGYSLFLIKLGIPTSQ